MKKPNFILLRVLNGYYIVDFFWTPLTVYCGGFYLSFTKQVALSLPLWIFYMFMIQPKINPRLKGDNGVGDSGIKSNFVCDFLGKL